MKKFTNLVIAGLFPLLASSAFALDGDWIGNVAGTQNWSTAGNWSGTNIADGQSAIANLTFDITAARNVTLDGSRTLGILNIGDPGVTVFAYTLAASSGSLTMDHNGLESQINLTAGLLNAISAPLQLTAGGLSITNSAGTTSAPTISSSITSIAGSGTQIITVSTNGSGVFGLTGTISDGNLGTDGVGVLVNGGLIGMTGASSFTGGLTISKGTVRATASGVSSGNGNIYLGDVNTGAFGVQFSPNGGAYDNDIIVSSSGTGSMKIESGGTFPAIAGVSGTMNGSITLGRTLEVNAVGGAIFLNGDISGAGGLSLGVNGAANVLNSHTISGNNTHLGGLKTTGSILHNIDSATAPGTGTWTIGPGNTTRDTDLDIDNTTGGAMTLTNNNAQIWSSFTFVGSDDMNMGTGGVTISDARAIITVLNNRLTVGGVISGASKIVGNAGAGTLALGGANSYTGATQVGGILAVTSLANGSAASNIGQSTNAAANLLLNRGILQYTGGAVTIDRLFTIGNGGAAIESSGAGALQFGNSDAIVSTDTVTFAVPLSFTATPATIISVGAVTSENTTAELAVGQTITGTGIAPGTTITQILNAHQIEISQATTGVAASGSYTFSALDRTLTLTGSNTGSNTIAGNLVNPSGSGKTLGVTKSGAGTWTLSAANTYSGATLVNAGTLVVSAGDINSSAVTVAAGGKFAYNSGTPRTGTVTLSGAGAGASNRAILGGTGAINIAVTLDNIGDTLSPGNSPGVQNFGVNQTWNSYTYLWETNNFTGTTAGTDFDQISIIGSLNLTGATGGSYLLDLNSLTAGNVAGNVPNFSDANQSWTILTTTAGISGFNAAYWTIATGNFTSSPAWTGTWAISQSSNDLVLSYTAVPEPTALALAISGVLCIALFTRRRKS